MIAVNTYYLSVPVILVTYNYVVVAARPVPEPELPLPIGTRIVISFSVSARLPVQDRDVQL